ncbi:MAG: OsmC family peroxiredoxin [Synergistaceae bacterium]|nr:OsmC family peroxiredoxin [Synergistaceae bacterium]
MSEKHTYTTAVEWTKERRAALSSRGLPTIEVATPPNFPGGHEGIWSPEHLYTAAAEVCLMTTFLSFAERANLDFLSYKSEADGILDKVEKSLLMTRIHIKPTITVANEADREEALKLIERAERYCLISNSIKSEVTVEAIVVVNQH